MVKIDKLLRMLPVFLMAISVTASAYDGDYDEAVNIIKASPTVNQYHGQSRHCKISRMIP